MKKISKKEAQQEIDELVAIYKRKFTYCSAFLVGICLGKTKHKFGDSGRYWELKKIIEAK